METILGLITVGQTPRPDLEAVFYRYAPGAILHIIGALDGLSHEQIRRMRGKATECPILCRLQDESECEVSLNELTPYVEHAAHQLAEQGAQLVVVLCTADFPTIPCAVPVLLPGRILPSIVQSISHTRHVAVVCSVEGQVPFARVKWEEAGFRADTTAAGPFSVEKTSEALQALLHSSAEMVILDCFGHDAVYKQVFVDAMQRPVLVAQTLIAGIAGELLSSGG